MLKEKTEKKLVKTFYAESGEKMIRQLLCQPNQNVRKAALGFLKSLVLRKIIPLDDEVIELAKNGCRDKLLSVRRNAILVFTDLMVRMDPMDQTSHLDITVDQNEQNKLRTQWIKMILEKLHDLEKTVKEGLLNFVITESLIRILSMRYFVKNR